jgi:hypothetical protein
MVSRYVISVGCDVGHHTYASINMSSVMFAVQTPCIQRVLHVLGWLWSDGTEKLIKSSEMHRTGRSMVYRILDWLCWCVSWCFFINNWRFLNPQRLFIFLYYCLDRYFVFDDSGKVLAAQTVDWYFR